MGCDESVGLVEYGPSAITSQVNDVNRFLGVVNKDVQTDVKNSGNFSMLKAWNDSVWTPWQAFYRDFSGWTSIDKLRDSTYRRAEAYRQLGLRFRENLQKKEASGTQVTPTNVPDPIHLPKLPDQRQLVDTASSRKGGGFPWKWLLIGGGVAAGGYALWKFWPGRQVAEHVVSQARPNPPDWVMDPDMWEDAKIAIEPYRNRYPSEHAAQAAVIHTYKSMGGKVGKANWTPERDFLMETYRSG